MARKTPGQPQARGTASRRRRTFRQEVLALHRAIFRDNQARINRSVLGYSKAFQRYELEYARTVKRYECRANPRQLDSAMARASIAYVGDYHTLAQAQHSFLWLLGRLPLDRPVTVALEFIQGRHQKVLDSYLAGRISERAFLRGIEYESHWIFGGWEAFSQILSLARERGYRVIGIDTAGQGPAGASLAARDRYAARRIARARTDPTGLVMVLVGELHIAPCHLPAQVDKELSGRGQRAGYLIIHQNCHEIYWQLEARGLEHQVELVRVARDQYCLMNTPPIVCQQSFLNWLEVDDALPHLEAPEETFKEFARLIAAFFDLPLDETLDEVELTTVVDLSFLARLRRRGDFSAADMRQIRTQILRSESYFIARAKMVYLGNLSVIHAAEEATHFLRHLCSNAVEPRLLVDAFYARCLEEAIGFLGSKLLNHKRKRATVDDLQRQARSRTASANQRRLARLVLKHVALEQGKRVRKMAEVYECDADTFNAITHILGYRLGERLYFALLRGVVKKQEIRDLFFDSFDEEGAPLATYLYLITLTAKIKMPERL